MKSDILIVEIAVGYMLKVLKIQPAISEFKNEFNAIRHGDYKCFINLIDGPIPAVVDFNNGEIKTVDSVESIDIDFLGLVMAGESLKIFYQKCKEVYGKIADCDISDLVYHKLISFELAIRMHANNAQILEASDKLQVAIDKLSINKQLSELKIVSLHKGRKFLNKVKHGKQNLDKWEIMIADFEEVYNILKLRGLTII